MWNGALYGCVMAILEKKNIILLNFIDREISIEYHKLMAAVKQTKLTFTVLGL